MEKARWCLNNYFLLARQSFDFSLENQNILMKSVLPRDQKHFPLVNFCFLNTKSGHCTAYKKCETVFFFSNPLQISLLEK